MSKHIRSRRLYKLFRGIYKHCECNCGELIHLVNERYEFSKYKNGHNLIKEILREKNRSWKGGRYIDTDGYVQLLRPHHKYASGRGYIREHRYFIELQLGRYLNPKEEVHHVDKDKSNNNLSNLMLFSCSAEHLKYERTNSKYNKRC